MSPRHPLQTQNTGGGAPLFDVELRNFLLPLEAPGDVTPAGAGDVVGGVDGEDDLRVAGTELQT